MPRASSKRKAAPSREKKKTKQPSPSNKKQRESSSGGDSQQESNGNSEKGGLPSIAQLYEECIGSAAKSVNTAKNDVETANAVTRSLSTWEERGVLRQTIWPRICAMASDAASSSGKDDNKKGKKKTKKKNVKESSSSTTTTSTVEFHRAAHLLAVFAVWEHRLGLSTDDSRALDFLVLPDQQEAWSMCLESLYSNNNNARHDNEGDGGNTNDNNNNNNLTDWDFSTVQVQFLAIALATAMSSSSTTTSMPGAEEADDDAHRNHFYLRSRSSHMLLTSLLPHVSGMHLWRWMPERRRELELRRHAGSNIAEEWEKQVKEQEDKNSKTPPFVIHVTSQILRLVEGSELRLGKIKMSQFNDSSSDEIGGGVEGARKLRLWSYLHAALDLLLDLVSYRTTRTYLIPYLDSIHFFVKCRMELGRSTYNQKSVDENMFLAQQLLERIEKLTTEQHGGGVDGDKELTSVEMRSLYHRKATVLQKMSHRYYEQELPDIIYTGVGLLCKGTTGGNGKEGSFLRQSLSGFPDNSLLELLHRMRLIDRTKEGGPGQYSREFLLQVLEDQLTTPEDILEELQSFPLYPTEQVLWDYHRIPPSQSIMLKQHQVLSLPKLPTQFLSFADYLHRNFELMRLASAYEIRSDLVDVIRRVRPVLRQSDDVEDYDGMMVDDDDPNKHSTVLNTEFTGWARMALELTGGNDNGFELKKVGKPLLGQSIPSQVVAEFTLDLKDLGHSIRKEWDALTEYDVLFLVAIDARRMTGEPAPLLGEYHLQHGNHHMWESDRDDRRVPDEDDKTFPERFGVKAVRGCMILQVKDEKGNILNDPWSVAVDGTTNKKKTDVPKAPVGTKRTFRVALDPSQYAKDLQSSPTGSTDFIYGAFNLVVRRHGRANNFKSVLETIRGLMEGAAAVDRVLPLWLSRIILGQGESTAASYRSKYLQQYAKKTVGVSNPNAPLDYCDTFLSEEHLRESFPDKDASITVDGRGALQKKKQKEPEINRRYRVRVEHQENAGNKKKSTLAIEAESYVFPAKTTNGNSIRFTPLQVEAVRSGLSPGMTVVVGPPGTGKTDTAVQIIASLYHSFPTQRTVIVTHSNAALNDIFLKVMARGDVSERYLVRLGAGERDLQTDSSHDFTKMGRVAYSLHRRGELLEQVQLLSESLGISGKAERGKDGAPAYTCETAAYFYKHQVETRIRNFERELLRDKAGINAGASDDLNQDVSAIFPFGGYFETKTTETSEEEDDSPTLTLAVARSNLGVLKEIFAELAEYRPLERLRSQRQRLDYLIMKQARVVAMTCTHAAIARSHLIKLGFEYDNVVIEEAGQMTEIETFIPLLLQRGEGGADANDHSSLGLSRLKRVCLFGDHNQLPPIIKNRTFAKYSNLDQSLFSRFIRLGVPYIQLDKQGRARPEIATLYSWRYKNLGNLDHLLQADNRFSLANAGLAHTFQLINVEDFEGKGETSPTAYFYQNVGEAEYAVALFQYMVLVGYSPKKITILTTYNGQRALIQDILNRRCGEGTPLAGVMPRAVSTVDQYQGQQNDYILLSLVRTKNIGHIRDVRRLVVAVSRARLGLYVFCRLKVFENCQETKPTWDTLKQRPHKLQLVVGENFPSDRKTEDEIPEGKKLEVQDLPQIGSLVHQMQEQLMIQS